MGRGAARGARPPAPGRLVLADQGITLGSAIELLRPRYTLEHRGDSIALDDAAWADWAPDGRLLVATHSGRLELRDADTRELPVVRVHDLAPMRPEPRPAPDWARRW